MEVLIMRVDTREMALVLAFPRPEEDIACSDFSEGALFGKAYFAEGSDINVPRVLSVVEDDLQSPA